MQEPIAGSFFAKYPRWRQLISINKPNTGKTEYDYAMRHDWNSLLNDPSHSADSGVGSVFERQRVACIGFHPTLHSYLVRDNATCYAVDYSSTDPRFNITHVPDGMLFKHYTQTYYPEAELLRSYFDHFASSKAHRGIVSAAQGDGTAEAGRPLNIRYGAKVVRVARPRGWEQTQRRGLLAVAEGSPRFTLTTASGDTFECTYLIWAGGLQSVNPPIGRNIAQYADSYSTASTNLTDYVNKAVLILGRG